MYRKGVSLNSKENYVGRRKTGEKRREYLPKRGELTKNRREN